MTNPGLIILMLFLYGLIVSLPEMLSGDGSSGLLSLVSLVIAGPMALGYYGAMLKFVRDEPVEVRNLFDGFQKFGQSVGVYLLSTFIILAGLLLFVVPGIILAVALFPALPLVYDGREGIVEVIKEAWDLTNGYKLPLFVLSIVMILFVLAGLIAFIIGIIVTGAIGSLIFALAYEELRRAKG